ncbi:MAG: S8 family serine peptidase, partial [Gammaproteobacteria bacterium]|nr:S8 family serine peptidase [Gammaproteobacteria bacterium]
MNNRNIFLLMFCLISGVLQADPKRDWEAPFDIVLPEPARNILLKAGVNAVEWARNQGIEAFSLIPRGRQGTILETRLNEEEWQQLQARACTDPGVDGCETVACQTIQFEGDVTAGDGSAQTLKGRLVRNSPELLPVPDDADLKAISCARAPLLTGLDAAGTGEGNLVLDLEFVSDKISDKTLDAAQQQVPGEGAQITEAQLGEKRAFQFNLNSTFTGSGSVRFDSEQLPADTSDWTLVVGVGCSEVAVPLNSLAPARAPGQVAAIVDGGASAAIAATFNLTVVREATLATTNETLAVFATADNIFTLITALILDPRVASAQPDYIYTTTATPGHSDPFASFVYGPEMIGALALHDDATGNGQLVAVIDTGVDVEHPELTDRIREFIDVTDKGWTADVHGTAVAGIIAANADNAEGGYGVAPEADILAIKACQPKTVGGIAARCWTSTLVQALDLAMTKDASVINMSLAGPPDELVERYVRLAIGQNRLVVAAAGNGGPEAKQSYPAAISTVLAVTAVDSANRRYRDANLGEFIDVSAPGVDIVSPTPNNQYPPLSGTSMAAAHVSGVA